MRHQEPRAHDALKSIRDTRTALAEGTPNSLSYDLVYGGVCALMVGGQGLEQPWSFVTLAIGFVGLAICTRWWKARHGFSVAQTAKRTRWVGIVAVGILILLMGASMWSRPTGLTWVPVASAAAAFVVAIVSDRLWQRVWKRELRKTKAS